MIEKPVVTVKGIVISSNISFDYSIKTNIIEVNKEARITLEPGVKIIPLNGSNIEISVIGTNISYQLSVLENTSDEPIEFDLSGQSCSMETSL